MPSVYDPENFMGRVNYASKYISDWRGQGSRTFDSCFEMCDGDAVAVAVYRRSLKNPKLAANLWRALSESSVMGAVTALAHVPTRKLTDAARAEREGHGEEWRAFMAGAQLLICGECGRWFVDESAELVADMLEAHKMIAHKPEPFDPAKVTVERHRFSVTQGEVTVSYDGRELGRFGDTITVGERTTPGGDIEWCGHSDDYWIEVARRIFEAPKTASEHDPEWQLFECERGARWSQVEEYTRDGDVCGFSGCAPDHTVRLVKTTLSRTEAHHWFRRPPEPDPEPYVPDELSDYSAIVRQASPRGEFRADVSSRVEGYRAEAGRIVEGLAECAHADAYTFAASVEGGGELEYKKCEECGSVTRVGRRVLTVSRDTLRAFKLINDAAVLEEKRAGMDERGNPDPYGRADIARVTLGRVETVINVAKLDKWAATFEAGDSFTIELSADGLALMRGASFIRFARAAGIPTNLTPIELTVDESGRVCAPALPSPEQMKAARKELAEGRKALRAERVRQNAFRGVNSALADVKRAEEYAAKLEDEAREAIQRAEELTEAECDEAVTLAKRVRDLRRLRREVERAAEDPQINTPEFFEWVTDEHKAAYAEHFTALEKANKRGWHKKAEAARGRLASVLRGAFDDHTRADVREIAGVTPEEVERDGEVMPDYRARETVFGMKYRMRFDGKVQEIKRTLRRFPHDLARARERIAEARDKVRESLEAYESHVRDSEREAYEQMLSSFRENVNSLARAA